MWVVSHFFCTSDLKIFFESDVPVERAEEMIRTRQWEVSTFTRERVSAPTSQIWRVLMLRSCFGFNLGCTCEGLSYLVSVAASFVFWFQLLGRTCEGLS